MADTPETAAALRARHDHYAATKAAAEAERARLLVDRAELGALLSDGDLDEVDAEIARLAHVVERAASRVALIKPALDRAAEAEAEADRRQLTAGNGMQDRDTVAGVAQAFGATTAAAVAVELRGAAIPPKPVSPTIFDAPPAPLMRRDDASWWEARERRERQAKAARIAGSAGAPALRSSPNYDGFRGGN